ncbi:hypothetical protein HanPSC8_Chr09g0397941 [Helianthus annuus]|nr:hypothetical protein HanPSC8_Chr09g0397941 [Helianthus annuus]
MYQEFYEPLFRDCVATGDKTKTPHQSQNEISQSDAQDDIGVMDVEGKADSDEGNVGDDVEILFPESNLVKRRKIQNNADGRSSRGKSTIASSLEVKLDTVIEALASRSTPSIQIPTLAECMDIVSNFPGFEPSSINYNKALRIFMKKEARESFMYPPTTIDKISFLYSLIDEMEIPNHGKYVNSDSEDENNDSNEEDWLDDEKRFLLLCGLVVKGVMVVHNMRNIPRIPCHTSCRTGNIFIQEILNGHPRRCYEDFRLHVDVFKSLCLDLRMHYNLKETRNVSIEESVGIFLLILAHGCGNRLAQEIFNHSGETIQRHFHRVLRAVLKLSGDIIMPKANYNDEVPRQLLNNSRYYPMFKDCIGAIDGTHVKASVREHEQAKYIGRKGYVMCVKCNI